MKNIYPLISKGNITFNDLVLLDFDKDLFEQLDFLKEDLLQVTFVPDYLLDVGWFPSFDKHGCFKIYVIKACNWEEPIFIDQANNFLSLYESIEKAILVL